MAITIEKRTRSLVTDPWGTWAETTDTPPYNNTDLVEYKVAEEADIQIDKLTNGSIVANDNEYVWFGTGIFDILINAVVGNIKAEYDSGRIVGQEYSTVYLGALQSVINTSANIWLQKPDTEAKINATDEQINASKATTARDDDLAVAKNAISAEQKALLIKQQALVERQTKGFDDDAKQKLLKQLLDSWSVAYSVAKDATSIPDSIKVDVIDSIMKNAYSSLGITTSTNPIGIA